MLCWGQITSTSTSRNNPFLYTPPGFQTKQLHIDLTRKESKTGLMLEKHRFTVSCKKRDVKSITNQSSMNLEGKFSEHHVSIHQYVQEHVYMSLNVTHFQKIQWSENRQKKNNQKTKLMIRQKSVPSKFIFLLLQRPWCSDSSSTRFYCPRPVLLYRPRLIPLSPEDSLVDLVTWNDWIWNVRFLHRLFFLFLVEQPTDLHCFFQPAESVSDYQPLFNHV